MKRLFLLSFTCCFISCSQNIGSDESSDFKIWEVGSTVSFTELYERVLEPKCLRCHDWAADQEQVNLRVEPANPAESDLYLSVENGEMPVGGPELSEREKRLVAVYIESQVVPVPKPLMVNPDSLQLVQDRILVPKCIRCHRWMNRPARVLKRITFGEPLKSTMYTRVADNTMPIGGPPLSDKEKQLIFDLIMGEELLDSDF